MIYPGALWLPSPNHSSREGAKVSVVVIHHISLPPSVFGGAFVEDFFLNRLNISAHPFFGEIEGLRVSSHFYIKRTGELLQFVDTDNAAWHAGVSQFRGESGVNRFSVGVELEGDMDSPYTGEQYRVLGDLLTWIRMVHPDVEEGNVVGHDEVSPGRKTDPGPLFDWSKVGRVRAGG